MIRIQKKPYDCNLVKYPEHSGKLNLRIFLSEYEKPVISWAIFTPKEHFQGPL